MDKTFLPRKSKLFIENEAGFALVNFVVLMPLLLAIFVVIFAAIYLLKDEVETKQICRVTTLSMQESVASDLNTLLKMNIGAKILRRIRDIADEAVVVAAGIPPAEAAAQAFKIEVIAAQTGYSLIQKGLIAKAKAEEIKARFEVQKKIIEALNQERRSQIDQTDSKSVWNFFSIAQSEAEISVNWPKFDVEASPKESLTPDYNPSRDFKKNSAIHVKWKLHIEQLLPGWMKKILSITMWSRGNKINMACGASLIEDDGEDSSDDSSSDSDSSAAQGIDAGTAPGSSSGFSTRRDSNSSARGSGKEKSSDGLSYESLGMESAEQLLKRATNALAKQLGVGKWKAMLNEDKSSSR